VSNVTRIFPTEPDPDTSYSFSGFVKSDAKFARDGMCTLKIEIPWECRDVVLRLLESADWPVEITVKPMEREHEW